MTTSLKPREEFGEKRSKLRFELQLKSIKKTLEVLLGQPNERVKTRKLFPCFGIRE